MTAATKITVSRLFLVPVFSTLAILYSETATAGRPDATLRHAALAVFVIAAVTDGIDGWIARRYDQISKLGAFLDPIADKALVLSALLVLTFFPWGADGWAIPLWFTTIVVLRDALILAGIRLLNAKKITVAIQPHFSGKLCTFSLFLVVGWIMLKPAALEPTALHPSYPCAIATVFVLWSAYEYSRQAAGLLNSKS